MLLRTLLPTTLMLLSFAAHAAEGDFARCASIAPDGERLACYDAAAGRGTAAAAPAPAESPITAAAERAGMADAGFGAEQLREPAQPDTGVPDRIESFLSGRFEGWRKDSVFELENGQVWRCVDCRDVYHVRERPKVTIERGLLGSYWLGVEGLNQQARVRRVK